MNRRPADTERPATCPECNAPMVETQEQRTATFKGIEVQYPTTVAKCQQCGLELADIAGTGAMQEAIADSYRAQAGLLTGEQIRTRRKEKNLTQQALAERLGIGVVSVKRWERGVVQTRSMDNLLRSLLAEDTEATVTLEPDIARALKARGDHWQDEANTILREHLQTIVAG